MVNDQVSSEHLAELVRKSSRLYGLFRELDAIVTDGEARAAASAELAGIVEFAVWQELSPAVDRMSACLHTAASGIAPLSSVETMAAWRHALEAGLPSRRACVTILENYADWLQAVAEPSRRAVADGLPSLAPFVADLGPKRMLEIIEAVASLPVASSVGRLMVSLKMYETTDADIMLGAVRVVSALLREDAPSLVAEIEKTITVERMMESNDACRLLPELGRLVQNVAPQGDDLVGIVVSAIVTAAAQNISSAYAATRALQRLSASMPAELAAACLRAMARILNAVGNRALGACAKRIPRLYARHGIEKSDAFVAAAVDVATRHGTTAGIWFIEGRTVAARSLLA